MTHDLYPERWRICYPGNNDTCLMKRSGFVTELILSLVLVFGMLVTVLGNFVVILSVCHFKQLQNPTNVLISSLALADLLVGVLVMPFGAMQTVNGCWYLGDMFCDLYSTLDLFFTATSVFHLICISIDRYQAICSPLHYSRRITVSVAVIMACVSWTLAAVYGFGIIQSKAYQAGIEKFIQAISCLGGCFFIYNLRWAILSSLFSFFLPCFVMVCLYTQIFIVAKQHVKKIGDKSNCSNDRGRGGLIKQSEHKAAKTLSIVLGAFIFCWTPLNLDILLDVYVPHPFRAIFLWMAYFNSALNPIIYALFYPCFKKCFHSIITLKIFSSNSSTMNLSVK